MLPTVCFVTAHPNPSNHFVQYVQAFEERGVTCTVIADKNVSKKFVSLKADVIELDLNSKGWMSEIEGVLAKQSIVITDIASERWICLHDWLKRCHPGIERAVYYDNPEQYVPGGYSEMAAKVIQSAQIVLFANALLPEKGIEIEEGIPIDLSKKTLYGIGYYPQSDAESILKMRNDEETRKQLRDTFLSKMKIEYCGQKIFIYTGGANDEYDCEAFPHFVDILSELVCLKGAPLKGKIVIIQQHPRAPKRGNHDAKKLSEFLERHSLPENCSIVLSTKDDMPTIHALAISDGVFYHQTSMAAQFALARIPVIAQVAHKRNCDILLNCGYPFVKEATDLAAIMNGEHSDADSSQVEKELGIDANWKDNLFQILD